MTIRVAIQHETQYHFDRPVNMSPHVLRLRPAVHSRTPIHAYTLKIEPENHFINWQQDPFGNFLARLVFPEKTRKFSFKVEVIADLVAINPFDFFVEKYAEDFPFQYDEQLKDDLAPFLEVTESGPLLSEWVASNSQDKHTINDFLVAQNQRLEKAIGYNIRMEPGIQSCEQTLSLAKGSCRDTSWLLVQIFRHLGLAARFVSGYLVQLKPDVKPLDGPAGAEEDFTDLHAWCEVYLPGAGWIGLDPTSGLFAGEGHIPLACTPDPISAAPIEGYTDECETEFSFSNKVYRIHEDPRVTKPYSEEQWTLIDALGNKVDSELEAMDVRLTMGGEPTFVSVDDMESAQWNTDALGAKKLSLSKDLLLRLRKRFGPGGVLHYGQGKWYPGEEVPRWALGCFWRQDGKALWQDDKLLARVDKDYGHGFEEAQRFTETLCRSLDIDVDYVQPASEDALYYLWKEQSLPDNVDPEKADLTDSLERKRIARLLSKGLDKPAGYVLPLAWNANTEKWQSSHWPLKRDKLVLLPGDSPLGFRLPLDSLPLMTEAEQSQAEVPDRDPFAEREPLADKQPLADGKQITDQQPTFSQTKIDSHFDQRNMMPGKADATIGLSADRKKSTAPVEVIRTALCVEPREGRLHVFMPPLKFLEHYIELIELIEKSARIQKLPVILEGYEPPRDPRLQRLLVTPDPGVIEVNIHPANNWRELVDNTRILYEEAHKSRLGTEKFMLDGRHTGTGGGNHITLGAAAPTDSPLLRRPDLLRSLVTYWQHHPSLSYLFSGMFIGPTSQAPRADEGRDEALYELEIAFAQMPEGIVDQPWLIDRLMRNLLTDITGNTHRAEFCIDKLYAPGTATGRQGLLEFRGFEMPPHYQMGLVQALLLRSLVARFWREPYHKPLVRWGTALHDKFMLPHFVWADMKDIVEDLQSHDIPFQLEWLAPFEEFRFPHYGRVAIGDINLELRWAIEPWHVLGEEVSSFGTARYVDSSVERLQIRLTGLTDSRYVLACNGQRVQLSNTGKKGEYVGGVRYRAWQPPSGLHPTIGVHAPLVFDLIDTWNGLAIGGCSYHVSHPGGLSYDAYPVNAFEAETRRVSRYYDFGHTPAPIKPPLSQQALRKLIPHDQLPRPMAPPPLLRDDEYPYTLDLRKYPEA
jgi:uncharacterized protein (DUF2126 family)/transglutaminase-like putative cysteine protease